MRFALLVGAVLIVLTAFVFTMKPEHEAPQSTPHSSEAASSTVLAAKQDSVQRYRVLKVIDGDTLAIEMNGKNTTLRLIGLDTPETSDPRKPVQCFGVEASLMAKELLSGQNVTIETDASQGKFDKYNRVLAYVYLPNGTLFNEYMIAEGFGHEYTYNLPYKYQTQFKAAEKAARQEKKGLWADDACALESTRAPTQQSTVTPAPKSGAYECAANTYNCASFSMQKEAQAAFESCGGNANDVHKLDSDKDGVVCESLP
ncbi:thermonuclease family protein [Candidatus Kaiserbacteria bacterium]|nr:thermonuclease family protein [Candidatus Kaiserbacteria bacterium]